MTPTTDHDPVGEALSASLERWQERVTSLSNAIVCDTERVEHARAGLLEAQRAVTQLRVAIEDRAPNMGSAR